MSGFFNLCNLFLWGAVVFAIFFGWRAVYIFVDAKIYKEKKWDWWLYQIWFNASGAFIGWAVLYFLSKTNHHHLNVGHFVALVIAFLGITGHLPYAALFGQRLIPKKPQLPE